MLRSVPSARDQERHMAPLRLALLGAPSVEVGGAPLRVDTRKAVALLAYLACSGRRHGRDQLATLLWPEADDAHARAALRRTLSALNHALGGVARVAADRSGLELVAPGMVLDIERFRKLVASCDAHGHEPDRACSRCAEPLAEAVALHRGDFLAGFALRDAPEFEDWQLAEADTLRRELAAALQRLVDAEAVRGRWQAAIADAERWLALDPLHEPAHRQLMRLYAWSGQRGAAMRQYRACVRILDEELGVSPLEETTALYQQVTEGGVEPPPTPPSEAAIPTPPPGAARRRPPWSAASRSGPPCRRHLRASSGTAGAGWSRSPARPASARPGSPRPSRPRSRPRTPRCWCAAATRASGWPTGRWPTGSAPPWRDPKAAPGHARSSRTGWRRPPGSCRSWPRWCRRPPSSPRRTVRGRRAASSRASAAPCSPRPWVHMPGCWSSTTCTGPTTPPSTWSATSRAGWTAGRCCCSPSGATRTSRAGTTCAAWPPRRSARGRRARWRSTASTAPRPPHWWTRSRPPTAPRPRSSTGAARACRCCWSRTSPPSTTATRACRRCRAARASCCRPGWSGSRRRPGSSSPPRR